MAVLMHTLWKTMIECLIPVQFEENLPVLQIWIKILLGMEYLENPMNIWPWFVRMLPTFVEYSRD